jgi:type II secretory pathway component PulC
MRPGLRRPPVLRHPVLTTRVAALLSVCLLAGCGAADVPDEPAPESDAEVTEAPREPLTIYQDEMEAALQRGLQPLIADVNLRPVHEGGRFVGWRIQFLKPAEPPYRGCEVRPGDVIVTVNDSPLERPDQMMSAWKALETADHVTFHVIRGDKPLDITYRIVPR